MAPLLPSGFSTFSRAHTNLRTSLLSTRHHQSAFRFYASQSYGGGGGDPKGEKPQEQGSNPATSDAEHPGPSPPDVGKGTGGGPTKKGSNGHGGEESMGSTAGNTKQETTGGPLSEGAAKPKIHRHDAPDPDTHSEEVKAHNAEVAKRSDKPHEGHRDDSDKVGRDYWKGELLRPTLDCKGHRLMMFYRARRRRQRSVVEGKRYRVHHPAQGDVVKRICIVGSNLRCCHSLFDSIRSCKNPAHPLFISFWRPSPMYHIFQPVKVRLLYYKILRL